MRELEVNLKDHSYKIIIENDVLDKLDSYIYDVYTNDKVFIITDDKVKDLYLDRVIKSLSKKYIVD